VILGLYVVAALGAAALPLARLSGELPAIVTAVLLVAAFVVGQQLVWYNGWLQIGGVLAAAGFVICTGLAAHSSILSWHGDRVEAAVTGVSVTHGYHYVLVDDQGHPIPGHLSEADPEFDIGDRVSVVVDSHNWVDPKTSGEVGAARPLWIAALISLALTMVLSVLGGRSRGSGRPPRSGPGGVWIFER
jgi:hypothetical protein